MEKIRPTKSPTRLAPVQLPVFVEKDEDGFYVVECPVLEGCYSQGESLDEALANIRDVVRLIANERRGQESIRSFHPSDYSLHTITV